MDVRIFEDPIQLAGGAADHLATLLNSGGRRSLGLAGGSTPAATYQALSSLPVNWDDVDLWLGDERWVAPDRAESNALMVEQRLLPGLNARFHRIEFGDGSDPEEGAARYANTLHSVFTHTGGHGDIALLGLGDDGHTASLFPGSQALEETTRSYVAIYVPHLEMWRLTATIPLLADCNEIVFLVSGEKKAEQVSRLVATSIEEPAIPARRVVDAASSVTLLLDRAAALMID